MPGQGGFDSRPNAIRIAKHLIVPKPQHPISFALDDRRTRRVNFGCVLAAIHFDYQLRAMAYEIDDEMADRCLFSKMPAAE